MKNWSTPPPPPHHRLLAAVAFLLTTSHANIQVETAADVDGKKREVLEPRIVNGEDVKDRYQYPFMVSLQSYGTSHYCGGTLIAPDIILTAAHCTTDVGQDTVQIGRYNLGNYTESYEEFEVAAFIKHPDYDDDDINYDYAIIKFDGRSEYEPVMIDEGDVELFGSMDLTVVGWGYLSEDAYQTSDVLQQTTLDYVEPADCDGILSQFIDFGAPEITDQMMCAIGFNTDACYGDSGGPLLTSDNVQVGIVSWGIGCDTAMIPGMYARISDQYKWIISQVCELTEYEGHPGCAPTKSPSPSTSMQPTSICMDMPEEWSAYSYWYGYMDCDWFAEVEMEDDYYDDGMTRCDLFGWYAGDPDDLTANEVCCACGGGFKRDPRAPSNAPSVSAKPTNSPAPTSMVGEMMTTLEGGTRLAGNMFDLVALRYVAITEFQIHLSYTMQIDVSVYTKTGSHVGAEYDSKAWSTIGEVTVTGRGYGNPTPLPPNTFAPVLVERNATQSFCILSTNYYAMECSYGDEVGDIFASTDSLLFMVGSGLSSSYIGAYVYRQLTWNGMIRYLKLKETDEPTASPSVSLMPSLSVQPSTEPTISAMPSISNEPSMTCRDVEGWYSYDSWYHTCDWFSFNATYYGYYGDDDYFVDRCENHGDVEGYPHEMTANQACCACGGGDHFLPSTSPSISTMPTVSAAPTSLCLDAPEDWFDEEYGVGCDFFSESSYNYYSNDDWVWQRCIDYGDVLQDENGLQAKDACCACGGGLDRDFDAPSDAPTLSPEPSTSLIPSTLPSLSQEPTTSSAPTKVCFDVEYWLDQYGHDCAWYEPNTWYDDYYYESTYMCTYYGDAYENEDLKMSANQACCICGGGQHTLPTPPPTVSTQPSSSAAPTSLCVDDPVDWKDSENQFGCTFFEQELDDWWYDEEESRCDLYWHWRDDNNVDVRDACCACGGGKLRDLDAPSDMPSVSMNPTISPAPTPKEHELVTTFEGGNGANGNMFDLVALRYLAIREFDVHTDSQFSDVMVYSKSGSYIGYEYQESAWTFILETEVMGKGEGNRTPLPANTTVDVEIMPDESAAFCIILSSGVSYTNGDYPGNQLFASNDHLKFYEGAALGSSYIGGSVYAYRIWNGAIRYSLLKLTDAPTAPPTLSMMPSMSSVPTMEPTVSAEPTSSVEPTMVCEDVLGWRDSFGDGCDWFDDDYRYYDDDYFLFDDDYRYYDDDFYYDDAFIRARNLQNTRAPTNSPNKDGSISPQTAQTRAPTNSPNSNGSIAPQTAQTKVPTSTITSQPVQPPSSYYYDDDANNTWSRCEAYGDFAGGMFNLTANQACCVCGGGQHTLPTASPTVSAAPTVSSAPTSVCEDDPAEWMDDYFGVTCETFDNDPELCIEWDWLSDINDVEAKEACCACGGGMKRDPRAPSDMPSLSMQPTISLAPTSSERELMTTMDGYSYGYGNMFDLTALRYLAIRELDLHCYYSNGIEIIAYIYTKDGSHMNSEYDPDAWAQAGKAQMSSTAGEGNLTPVPATAFGNGTIVEIMPNATVAFCILLDSRVVISSYGSYQGNVFASDDNLIFYEGVGLQTSYIGGYVYSPLVWNGAIRYSFLKLTDKPSISPSISLAPSVSNAPTMEPTISAEPSISAKPTKSCADVPNWHDRHDDGCDWYDADINRCATYGDHHGGLFNMTANQACCVCGGGDHRMPSAAPTVTAAPTITAQPTGECTNHDSWGIEEIEMHCGWFEDDDPLYYFYMDDGDTRCDMFGFMSDENNVPAREACCVCGGGTKRERITTGPPTATPSLLPTVEPTNAPSSTPNVEPTNAPSSTPNVEPTSSPSIEPSEVVTQTVEPSSTPSVKPSVASQSNVVQETSSSVSSTWSSLRLSFLAVLVQGFFCV